VLAHRALELLDPRFGLVAALAGLCQERNILWGYPADPQFDRKEAVRFLRLSLSVDDGDWIARGGPSNSTLLIEGVRTAGLPD